jgi:hypothetical protein
MSYTHLTEKERYVISHLKCAGFSYREIGRLLNRSHTSISRPLTTCNNAPNWTPASVSPCLHDALGVKYAAMAQLSRNA